MKKVLISLPVLLILLSLLTVNCFASDYTSVYDVSPSSAQASQLAGYVFNIFPYCFDDDYLCFSTSNNDFYFFTGEITTISNYFCSGYGRVVHMYRNSATSRWSFSWAPDDSFTLYFGAMCCGSVQGTIQLNSFQNYYHQNIIYIFFTLLIVISGFSMFLTIKRSLD